MAPADPSRGGIHLGSVGDVADLRLGAELGRDALEPLRAACKENALPAALGEEPGGRSADTAGATGYDGDANRRRVLRLIRTVSSIGSA
jgi:hypothetical protein